MDFSPFSEHLGYLGYKTREETFDSSVVLFADADSSTRGNFTISHIKESPYLLVRSNWGIADAENQVPANIYEIVNLLNAKAVNISSVWYYVNSDGVPTLGISSNYFGEYDKGLFSSFIETFLADVQRVLSRKETRDLTEAGSGVE